MNSEIVSEVTLHRRNEDENPEIAPHTCRFCQDLVVGVDRREKEVVIYEHGVPNGTITINDCFNAALKGCTFCKYFLLADGRRSVTRLEDVAGYLANIDSNQRAARILWTTRFHGAPDAPVLYIMRNNGIKPVMGKFHLYETRASERGRPDPECAGGEVQHALNRFLPPNLVPDSRLSEQRALKWLEDCERGHHKCRAYQGVYRPKRLLEVTDDGRMIRIQSNHVAGTRYATLSYCWGGDQPMKATKDTVEALSQFFDVEMLPASIRDGVKVATKLEFRFLWVDALCIVQDDDEDKADQIAQMHKIYTGSILTIAASSASASSQGFLQPHLTWKPTLLIVQTDSGSRIPVLAVPADTHVSGRMNVNPLFHRAWAYQENQITTRILSFGVRNMTFFCLEAEHQDGGNDKVDLDCYLGEDVAASGFLNPGMKSLNFAEHPKAWTDLVRMYSKLGLSVHSDKLPAMAALAEEYGKRFSLTKYLAGVWLEDILWQLLWSTRAEDGEAGMSSRPPAYCGPSWSWCSIVGRVIFFHQYKQLSDIEFSCSVQSASTQLHPGSNQFGRVDHGTLVLTGHVRDLVWFNRVIGRGRLLCGPTSYARGVKGNDNLTCIGGHRIDQRLEAVVDVESEWNPDSDITLSAMEIGRFRDNFSDDFDKTYTRALLLHKIEDAEGKNVYCRAGMLFISRDTKEEDWFDDMSTHMQVTII